MEKDLVLELFNKAKRAADLTAAAGPQGWSAEEERCLDALNRLKQVRINRAVAFATQIGKRLRQLNNHPSKRIRAMSTDVIETFQRAILQELFNNNNGGEIVKVEAKPKIILKDNKKQGKQGIMIKLKIGPVSAQKTNDKNRDFVREKFAQSLCKVADEADDDETLKEAVSACDPCAVAVKLETELFKAWGSFNGPKKLKYRSLLFNINDTKNPDFRRRVLLGLFPADIISTLRSEDMASNARRLENDKIIEKKMFRCEVVQSAVSSSMET